MALFFILLAHKYYSALCSGYVRKKKDKARADGRKKTKKRYHFLPFPLFLVLHLSSSLGTNHFIVEGEWVGNFVFSMRIIFLLTSSFI